jgi:hypothetical protein
VSRFALVHELKLAGVWTEITDDVLARDPVAITRGRPDEGSRTDPGTLTLTLNNRDGRYHPRNPRSPLWGLIGRNTSIRTSVRAGRYLDVPAAGRASTPDAAVLDITGDLDIRADTTSATLWAADAGITEVMGKYDNVSGDQRSWRLRINDGFPSLIWSPDGTSAAAIPATSSALVQPPRSGRIALRAVLDVNNGAGGWTVTYYTAPTIAGPWVQHGTPVTGPGVTSIYNSTAPLTVGATASTGTGPPNMRVHAVEVRNGIAGTVVAAPDFTAQATGATSWADSAGRTWTVTAPAAIDDRWPRITAEVSEWPPRWDLSGQDVWTPVHAAGILRRLGQGKTPLRSPLYREFSSPARTHIVAYWPCEDGERATQFAAANATDAPLVITGTAAPAAYSGWHASAPLPTMGTATATAPLPAYTATGQTSMRFWLKPPDGGVATEQRVITLTGTGTAARWTLSLLPAGTLRLRAWNAAGTSLLDSGAVGANLNGLDTSVVVQFVENGANVDWGIITNHYDPDSMYSPIINEGALSSIASASVGQITTITVGEDRALGDTVIGHIAVADDTTAYANTSSAAVGWAGETAQARITRLCQENGIPFLAYGWAGYSIPVGPQPMDTLLDVLEAAAEADGGILGERIDDIGLTYRARVTLYNQNPSLALEFDAAGELPGGMEPTDDDQGIVNDITAKRINGSSARAVLESGPLSVQDPPDGIGRVDDAPELNLYRDSQLADVAGWLLHTSTWDDARYPRIPVSLTAGPHLIDQVLATDAGDRLTIDNLPAWLPPGLIDQMARGYTETLTTETWNLVYNCTPYGPYTVAVLDDATLGRLDTAGSTLTTGVSSTATSLSVTTTSGPLWTTSDVPFDITVAGERMTVTAITGAASPQTATVTRSVNGIVKAQTAGAPIALFQPAVLAL